jgi:hypothetical protein
MMFGHSNNIDTAVATALATFAASDVNSSNLEGPKSSDPVVVVVFAGSFNKRAMRRIGFNYYEQIQAFALLPSTRCSWWLLPIGNRACSLAGAQIYMPYSWRARFLKRLLLGAIRFTSGTWAWKRALIGSTKPLLLQQLVANLTNECDVVFSLLLGTPGPFRKLTIQVMRPNGAILGYIKLPLTDAAIGRVSREAATLQSLSEFASLQPHIPRRLYSGEWQGGHLLFVSSGPFRPGPTTFGPQHQRFLERLRNIHSVEKPGSILVREVAERWQKVELVVDPVLRELGRRSLACAERDFANSLVQCGITHGDFAPWNTRLDEHGELFVFDWESAAWEAPISWDMFHFHVQTTTLLKRSNQLSCGFCKLPAERASFLLYMLSSISLSYEHGGPPPAIRASWQTILQERLL